MCGFYHEWVRKKKIEEGKDVADITVDAPISTTSGNDSEGSATGETQVESKADEQPK